MHPARGQITSLLGDGPGVLPPGHRAGVGGLAGPGRAPSATRGAAFLRRPRHRRHISGPASRRGRGPATSIPTSPRCSTWPLRCKSRYGPRCSPGSPRSCWVGSPVSTPTRSPATGRSVRSSPRSTRCSARPVVGTSPTPPPAPNAASAMTATPRGGPVRTDPQSGSGLFVLPVRRRPARARSDLPGVSDRPGHDAGPGNAGWMGRRPDAAVLPWRP